MELGSRSHFGDPDENDSDTVWKRSFSVGDTADVPLGIRVFGIGWHLAELIVELCGSDDPEGTPPEAQQRIDQLNRDFGNLREVLQSSDASLAAALIEPVIDRFIDSLQSLYDVRSDLAERCDALAGELRRLLDPPPPEPTWDASNDDVPF